LFVVRATKELRLWRRKRRSIRFQHRFYFKYIIDMLFF